MAKYLQFTGIVSWIWFGWAVFCAIAAVVEAIQGDIAWALTFAVVAAGSVWLAQYLSNNQTKRGINE